MSPVMSLLGPAALASARAWGQVRAQVVMLGAGLGKIMAHSERSLAVVTATTNLRTVTLRFEGQQAEVSGEILCASLFGPGRMFPDNSATPVQHRAGASHSITLRFTGYEAIAAGETFRACLPDHEFSIPGQLVADASVVRAEHSSGATPTLTIDLELLILEDN